MATGHLHAKALFPGIGSIVLACLFACPAPAGDDVRVVPLWGDGRGNQAWVEVEPAGTRMKATPFVAIGGGGLREAAGKPEEIEGIPVPLPGIMRLVESARKAFGDRKRLVAERNEAPIPAAPDPPGIRGEAPAPPPGCPGPGKADATDPSAAAGALCENCDFRARAPAPDRVAAGCPDSVPE